MLKVKDGPTRLTLSQLTELTRGNVRSVTLNGVENADSNYLSSASFGYDNPAQGLKSTQQLRVDWSKFENHTFFNSATAKVNVAFEKIVNGYPFDGSKKDIERYLDSLTGYEKYVLDSFPHNRGYLFFSQSSISIVDHRGTTLPDLSRETDGANTLDPRDDPYTVEFFLYLPPEAAGLQVVFQKQTTLSNVGVCSYVKSGSSAATAEVAWAIYSGSAGLIASATIDRDNFTHIANVYSRDDGKARLYVDGELKFTSTSAYQFETLRTDSADVTIGSGSSFVVAGTSVTPQKVLSGALDELRVFKEARNVDQVSRFRNKNVFAQDNLVLYYKFNEPTGTLSGEESSQINSIVLDSSGNGYHAYVTGFAHALRSTGSISTPLSNERLDLNPVIFPNFPTVATLNTTLLLSASFYDQHNPNLITRLVPRHYLTEGQEYEGLTTETGTIDDAIEGTIPGTGKLGSTQVFLGLLYTWAKFFDELKMFVDAFSKLHYVDYDEHDTTPDVFLPFALKQFGLDIPNFFSDAALSQYKDGEDVEPTYSLNDRSLQYVQNQIMRRVLTNMGDIVRSKGTIHSIEAFFRSVGIDPNNSFKIKERGGPSRRSLGSTRETRLEPTQFLDFSRGGTIQSLFLSSSRVEVGTPAAAGTFVQTTTYAPHGISNDPKDGLWTSGSWTFEALYRWPHRLTGNHPNVQSIARMHTSASTGAVKRLQLNLLAVSGSSPKLVLYARPGDASTMASSPLLTMTASVDVFDKDVWYISFGQVRNDLTGTNNEFVSSSYFLRYAKQNFGELTLWDSTSSFFDDVNSGASSVWRTVNATNTSGSFVQIGSASVSVAGSQFLNSTTNIPADAIGTAFDGQISRLRFWSKALSEEEWLEHARNPTNTGVQDPHVNFNFGRAMSGSWQRLRQDVTMQQATTASNASSGISMFDYSQNRHHYSGSNFPASTKVLLPQVVGYSYLSPQIDEANTTEKVRVRGYDDFDKVNAHPWAQTAPIYEVPRYEEPQDDPRLSIEFSLVEALNRDIGTMFATMEALDTALGAPENEFSPQYAGLEHLKEIYFNRLIGKLNFRAFFDFFRWFDSSVGYFVEHLIPRKTVYHGTNFVVESHMLERHKKQYFHYGMYLSQVDRPRLEDHILLQQLAGTVKKF